MGVTSSNIIHVLPYDSFLLSVKRMTCIAATGGFLVLDFVVKLEIIRVFSVTAVEPKEIDGTRANSVSDVPCSDCDPLFPTLFGVVWRNVTETARKRDSLLNSL